MKIYGVKIKKRYIALYLCIVFFFVFAYLVSDGYYPIVSVNGNYIMENEYRTDVRMASRYASAIEKTYADIASTTLATGPAMRTEILTKLVEQRLVRAKLKEELKDDYPYLLSNKLRAYDNDMRLKWASASLFGLKYSDFKVKFLAPQAERDILVGRLYLNGKNFDEWLVEAKKNANVSIFSGKFSWDGEAVRGK